jgi:hypothetical protein
MNKMSKASLRAKIKYIFLDFLGPCCQEEMFQGLIEVKAARASESCSLHLCLLSMIQSAICREA